MQETQNIERRPRWRSIWMLGFVVILCFSLAAPVFAQESEPWPASCQEFELGGQIVLLCMPEAWNTHLVIYAHGYVAPQLPLDLPRGELEQAGGEQMITSILDLGFAFMTTSYSKNGWALEAAQNDLTKLVHFAEKKAAAAGVALGNVYLTGASEGGLVTVMMIERHSELFAGGLVMCGPIGGAPYQVEYVGDFRVVFDYFFPEIFDFPATEPGDAYLRWEDTYLPAIQDSLLGSRWKRAQLFNVTAAPWIPGEPETALDTAESLLFYSLFGTGDLVALAGSFPYDNADTVYSGSFNDRRLNRQVERVTGDPSYLFEYYQPTGKLQLPLVTLHTLIDGSVPYRHELIYRDLVEGHGKLDNLTSIPVASYGHCNFEPRQVLGAFGLLFLKSQLGEGAALQNYIERLPDPVQ